MADGDIFKVWRTPKGFYIVAASFVGMRSWQAFAPCKQLAITLKHIKEDPVFFSKYFVVLDNPTNEELEKYFTKFLT